MRRGIRELKEKAILRKVLLGWLGVLWVFLGSYLAQGARTIIPSLVLPWSLAREIEKVQGKIILIKRTFPDNHNITKSAGKGGTTS